MQVCQCSARRYWLVLLLILVPVLSPMAGAQTTNNPLNFENNYFVTGDYVVGGWLRSTTADIRPGYAQGTISIPDAYQKSNIVNSQAGVTFSVPAGADVVAAELYWQTVEKSSSTYAGAIAYFNGYPVAAGLPLGKQPPSWSSGGCSGPSNGTTVIQTYRADVRAYLPIQNGIVQVNNQQFKVEFADSGSNGNTAPFTLGATLVIVYRVLSPDYPMNAIVIYDGGFAPSTTMPNILQSIWGFYQPSAKIPLVAKLTHIVGNGQANKLENVSFNGTALPTLYNLGTNKGNPPFPGLYGDWDNPTWDVSKLVGSPPAAVSTEVDSASTNSGCVSWGAIVFSATVDQSDNDGLLDTWKTNQGYCSAGVNNGTCSPTASDPGWVDLTGAKQGEQDVFIQADTMCQSVSSGVGICKIGSPGCTCSGSYAPPVDVTGPIASVFSQNGIFLHWVPGNNIQAPVCQDNGSQLCMYPTTGTYSQEGVVPWKSGLVAIKNQPMDYANETEAECESSSSCVRVFQPGRKDSYHYMLFANRLAAPRWSFAAQNLINAVWNTDNTVSFTVSSSTPSKLDSASQTGYDRITVAGAISVPGMDGTFKVNPIDSTHFSISLANEQYPPTPPSSAQTYTLGTDPNLAIYTGNAGTGSGMSDIGGSDSVITLGGWGGLATYNAFAGTTMHEFGHTLGLTHGGYSYPNYAYKQNYVPVSDPNCKPNYQSIMSYLFQVDLLWNGAKDGSRVLDFSSPALNPLSESSGGTGIDPNAAYAGTKWYALSAFNGTGTPATRHCDGTPLNTTDAPMYETEGLTSPVPGVQADQITWIANQDINYDGKVNTYGGFSDWAQTGNPGIGHMDLRQIGATGSNSSASGYNLGIGGGYNLGIGGGYNLGIGGGYNLGIGGGYNLGIGGGYNLGIGGGYNLGIGGGYNLGIGGGEDRGEINSDIANSYVRAPRFLTANLGTGGTLVNLGWKVPTFGMIDHYNVYRKAETDTNFTLLQPTPQITGTSYTDAPPGCAKYTYYVTSVIADPAAKTGYRESIASNTQTITTLCIFTGFGSPLQTAGGQSYSGSFSFGKTLTFTWQLQDPITLAYRNDLNLNTVLANYAGPAPSSGKCPVPSAAVISGNPLVLYNPGVPPTLGTFSYDPKKMNFVYNWNTATSPNGPGCYVLEVDVSYGLAPGFTAYKTSVQLK
jgi:hypothetical protein